MGLSFMSCFGVRLRYRRSFTLRLVSIPGFICRCTWWFRLAFRLPFRRLFICTQAQLLSSTLSSRQSFIPQLPLTFILRPTRFSIPTLIPSSQLSFLTQRSSQPILLLSSIPTLLSPRSFIRKRSFTLRWSSRLRLQLFFQLPFKLSFTLQLPQFFTLQLPLFFTLTLLSLFKLRQSFRLRRSFKLRLSFRLRQFFRLRRSFRLWPR